MAKIVILGAGLMGSAFSVPLVENGHDMQLVGTHLDIVGAERHARRKEESLLGKPEIPRRFAPSGSQIVSYWRW